MTQVAAFTAHDFLVRGVYTRKIGLDRETNKQLLLKHIRDNDREGSPFRELAQVLPSLSRRQVQELLRSLRSDGHVRLVGQTSAARWHLSQRTEGTAERGNAD